MRIALFITGLVAAMQTVDRYWFELVDLPPGRRGDPAAP